MLRPFCLFDGATGPSEMDLRHLTFNAKKGPARMGCQYGRREAVEEMGPAFEGEAVEEMESDIGGEIRPRRRVRLRR
jgi:hypothetical protein